MILVNGRQAEWHQNLTITGVLEMFNYTSPKIVVKVNGQVVRQDQWDTFLVQDGDDVRALHLIGGG